VVRYQTGVHQGDFLGNLTLKQARRAIAAGKPFFIHVTPVMPHWGTCYGPDIPEDAYPVTDPHFEWDLTDPKTGKHYSLPISPCPSKRHAHAFDGKQNTHIAGVWNVSIKGPRPAFMQSAFELPNKVYLWHGKAHHMGNRLFRPAPTRPTRLPHPTPTRPTRIPHPTPNRPTRLPHPTPNRPTRLPHPTPNRPTRFRRPATYTDSFALTRIPAHTWAGGRVHSWA